MAPPVCAMLQVIGGNYVTERDSEHYLILSSLVFSFGDHETVFLHLFSFPFSLFFLFLEEQVVLQTCQKLRRESGNGNEDFVDLEVISLFFELELKRTI